jgi:[ribosomal protein S18]-alanine N-acetyltransferase
VLAELTEDGVRAVYLEVRESNQRARTLYESSGFDSVGRRRGYYRHPLEDALVLRREIGPT